MSKLKQKKYVAILGIVLLIVGVIGLFTFGKVDKYKGLVKVSNINLNEKVLSSVGNTSFMSSKGTDEVEYNLTYILDKIEGLEKRDVIIKGTIQSEYAHFKEIEGSTLSNEGKEIEIELKEVELGKEQELTLKIIINNAPNKETIKPRIEIKESTGEYTSVETNVITVETNSVEGTVIDEKKVPVGNIELSINKNGKEIKRTYTNDNGVYVFSDLEEGTYEIKVEEDMYELTTSSQTSENNDKQILTVKEIDKFNIEVHKYIKNLKLIINGKEENYSYKDAETVIQNIKNAKTISGEIEYKIVVKNNSEKEEIVERLIDEPNEGLEFNEKNNTGWKKENNKLIYTPIEGSSLNKKETREVKLVLSITNTNEIKEYLNRLTVKGEIKEKVVFIVDNEIAKEETVVEGDTINKPSIEEIDTWYTDKNYTNKYNFKNEVTKDLILYAKTDKNINKYKVEFIDKNPENNEEKVIETKEVEEGNVVEEIESPSKEGYTFIYFVDENNKCFDYNTKIEKDYKLVSKYEINKYKVTFIDSDETYLENEVSYKNKINKPSNPEKEYFTFKYWSLDKEKEYDFNSLVTEDIILYSVYEKNVYNIKYIDDGEIIRDEEVDAGSIIQSINVSKEGYNFKYWSIDRSSSFNFNNPIVSDTTLYSVYEPITYTITYNLNKGTIEGENPTSYTIESDDITLINPTKEGYIFTGWSGTGIEESSSLVTITKGSIGDREYEANYSPIEYTISYDLDGGSLEEGKTNPNSYTIESENITLINPKKTGYTFTGWSGTEIEGTTKEVNISKGSIGNRSYKANYKPKEYTITYKNLTEEEITNLNNPSTYTVESNDITLNNPSNRLDGDGDLKEIFNGWKDEEGNVSLTLTLEKGSTGNKTYEAVWIEADPDVYPIYYNLNGGSLEEGKTNPTSYTKKDNTFTLNNPSKEGYTFTGWTGSNGETPESNVTIEKGSRGERSYVANFTPIEYTISYDLDGGEAINPSTYTIESEDILLTNPSKIGYDFIGWSGTDLVGENNTSVHIYKGSTGNRSYTANYEINKFNVSFIDNNNEVELKRVEYNKKVSKIDDPEKIGYTFKYWSLDKVNEFDFNTNITEDITLYSVYEINNYTITYNLNNGTLSNENPSTYTIESDDITLNNPTKEGYKFVGWSGTNLDNNSIEVTITKGSIGNRNYTANYEKVDYEITYNLNGGTLINENPTSYTIESDDITLNNPSKEGYTFTGWIGSNGSIPSLNVTIESGSIGNKSYTANFEVIEYTISYNLNDGILSNENPSVYTIESNDITLNNPTKEGYDFVGWSGTGIENRIETVTISSGSIGDREYTANFEVKKYTVTFMNGTSVFKRIQNIEYGTAVSNPEEKPTEAHKIFDKWVDANDNEYDFSSLVTENKILYASYMDVTTPTISQNPTEWTKENVTVNITTENSDYKIMYKINDGEYQEYSDSFEVEENCTIYAYSLYEEVNSLEVTHDVTNIDKINPEISEIETGLITPISAVINVKAIDNLSGLSLYKVYVDEELVYTSNQYESNLQEEKEETYTITNLEELTTYTVKVEFVDRVGNINSEEKEITTTGKHYVSRIIGINNSLLEEENYIKFESLNEALEYEECVSKQCTIELIDDVEESNVVLEGQDITLSLNGKTITAQTDVALENNGSLLIIDNSEEVGSIVSSVIAIKNTGILQIGENEEELVVNKEKPIIEGNTYGVENEGTFKFYDGKIIGDLAVRGDVNETPFSYNASINDDAALNKQIATLEIIADAEARIKSTYYTKLSGAVEESKIGSFMDVDLTSPLIKQVYSTSDYKMIYNEEANAIVNNNVYQSSTTATGIIKIDLTNYEVDELLTINAEISSQSTYDIGYVTILETEETPEYTDTNGRFIYLSGEVENRDYTKILEHGKVYYLHIGYRKDGGTNNGLDTFKINDIRLGDYVTSSLSNLNNAVLLTDSTYYFKKQEDGSYVNTNNSAYRVTADSYMVIDLTNVDEEKWILVTANYETSSNNNFAYISVTNSASVPSAGTTNGRYLYLNTTTGDTIYPIKLNPNQNNFIHFCTYIYSGNALFTIKSIRTAENDLSKVTDEVMTNNGDYYFENKLLNDKMIKNLSGSSYNIWFSSTTKLNEEGNGIVFDGTYNSPITLDNKITNSILDEETVEIKFSTTSTSNQVWYAGNNNEKITVGIYNGKLSVNNDYMSYQYFQLPEDLADGNIKTITVTYKDKTYRTFYNGEELPTIEGTDAWGTDSNSYIGRSRNGYYFNGTIYQIKLYNKVLTETEISDTSSVTSGLLFYIDPSITTTDTVYVNNNQGISNSTANSYIKFDLTDFVEDQYIIVNYTINSQNNNDYGYITLTDSTDAPAYNNTTGRLVYTSNNSISTSEVNIKLTSGKVNYLHFGYYKNGSGDTGLDSFIINSIKYYTKSESTLPTYIIGNYSNVKSEKITYPKLNEEADLIQIIRNVTLTNPLEIVKNRKVTLDLNGYTLTTSKEDYVVKNYGDLTIVDTDYSNQPITAREKYLKEQQEYDKQYEEDIAAYNKELEENLIKYEEKNRELINLVLEYMNSDEYTDETKDADYTYTKDDAIELINTGYLFDYTGEEQEFIAPLTGSYTFEVWGAQGGYRSDSSMGGKGGYAKGTIPLTKGEKVYIYVGGSGNTGGTSGGFNGGGSRDIYNGGGGATDIRIEGNTLYNRIIVAGGGGSDGASNKSGKAGGGLNGISATEQYGSGGDGATQTSAGNRGSFGVGGNGTGSINNNAGAGGGGWYGGGGSSPDSGGDDDRGGGGGSGFAYDGTNTVPEEYAVTEHVLTDTILLDGTSEIPTYDGTSKMSGNSDNGYAKISFDSYELEKTSFEYEKDIEISLDKFTFKSSQNGPYDSISLTSGILTSTISRSENQSVTYYNDLISIDRSASLKGTIRTYQNASVGTYGKIYIGLSKTNKNDTDFVVYDSREISALTSNPEQINFELNPTESGKYYFKIILYHYNSGNNIYADLIDLKLLGNIPTRKLAVLDTNYTQKGNITSTTNSLIYNQYGANLNIENAILNVNKSGSYSGIFNFGTLTLGKDAIINVNSQNNRGITNAASGDILDSLGTINLVGASTNGLYNYSYDSEISGLNINLLVSNPNAGILNDSMVDITYNDINIKGTGYLINFSNNDKNVTINNSTLYKTTSGSMIYTDSIYENPITINNSKLHGSIIFYEKNYKKYIINNSVLEPYVSNYTSSDGYIIYMGSSSYIKTNFDFNNCTFNSSNTTNFILNYDSDSIININNSAFNLSYNGTSSSSDPIINNFGELNINNTTFENTGHNRTYAIINKNKLTFKGNSEIKGEFIKAIHNEAELTIGDNENEVNINYPKIYGKTNAIEGIDTSIFNFYDGVLTGNLNETISGTINLIPENYDLDVNIDESLENITLKNQTNEIEKKYIAQIGDKKYTSLQAAVNDVPNDNTKTTINLISDYETANQVTTKENTNIILNLNSHLLKTYKNSSYLTNNGTFELNDLTSDKKDIKTYSKPFIINNNVLNYKNISLNLYPYSNALQNNGTFNFESGKIYSEVAVNSNIIENNGIYNHEGGTFDIIFTQILNVIAINNNNEMNVSDGLIRLTGNSNTCGNGYSCHRNSNLINNNADSKLKITGGEITKTYYGGYTINNYGTIDIIEGKFTNNRSEWMIVNNNNITITGGEFGTSSNNISGVLFLNQNDGVTSISNIDIYSGSEGVFRIYSGTMTINNTNATSTNSSLFYIHNGTLNVTGGEIKGPYYIINDYDNSSINAVFDNVKITSTSTSYYAFNFSNTRNSNITFKNCTINNTGNGINISSNSNALILNLENTNITSTNGHAIYASSGTPTLNIKSGNIIAKTYGIQNTSASTINIGEVGGIPSKENPVITGGTYGLYNSNANASINFYDGIITGQKEKAIYGTITDVESGYEVILKENEDGTESKYLDRLPVVKNKELDKEYYSIQLAIDEAESGNTLELLREYTSLSNANTLIVPDTKNIIFDLNGYRILVNNTENEFMINNGTFILTNSESIGGINISACKFMTNNGTFNFENGKVYSETEVNKIIIENNGIYNHKGGTLDIIYYQISDIAVVLNNNEMNVSSGLLKLTGTSRIGNTSSHHYSDLIKNVNSTSTLTITGGEIAKTYYGGYTINNYGTVDISDGKFTNDSSVYLINNNNKTTVTGGEFGTSSSRINSIIIGNYNNGEATISDIDINISREAFVTSTGTLNINNVKVDSSSYPIFYLNGGILNVTGGEFLNSREIIHDYGNNTVATFDNAKLTTTAQNYNGIYLYYSTNITFKNSIITSGGVALYLGSTSVVTIENTTLTSGGTSSGIYLNSGTPTLDFKSGSLTSNSYAIQNNTSSTITIGEEGGTLSISNPKITGETYGLYNTNSSATINFYDGIITGQTDKAIYGSISSTEAGYEIVKKTNENGTESKYLDLLPFIKNKRLDKEYDNFNKAIEEMTNGDTLMLIREYSTLGTTPTMVIPEGKDVIFDLNGYKLLQNNSNYPLFTNNGTLKLIDGVTNSDSGILVSSGQTLVNNGTFNFESGKIYSNISIGTNTIENNGIYNNIGGTIDIVYQYVNTTLIINNNEMNVSSGILKIRGGNYGSSYKSYLINNATSNSTLTITGGELSKTHIYGDTILNYGILEITDGIFTNNNNEYLIDNHNNATITGGEFGSSSTNLNSSFIINQNYGESTISNIEIYQQRDVIFRNYSGTTTINNVKATTLGSNLFYIHNGTLNVTGGEFSCPYYIINDENSGSYLTATFDSTKLTTTRTGNQGIYLEHNTNITIKNSELNFSGGGIKAHGNTILNLENNDITTNGDGISITSGSPTINIKSGNITAKTYGIYNTNIPTINIGDEGGIPSITNPVIYGETYGLYNTNSSAKIYFYDGVIKGKTGSIYGTITDVEPGYKEKRDSVTENDVTTTNSTLTILGSEERVAVVNKINFNTIQSAVNYAVKSNIENIQLYKEVTLEDNLVKPEGINIKIYLGNNAIIKGSYTIDSGIELIEGMAPDASLSRFMANITGEEINPKNIVIYQMEDGSSLKANITYKLYELIDNEYKIVKVNENILGEYEVGKEQEEMNTVRGKIYLNNIGEGKYKLVETDQKEINFEINENSVSSNIRENNMKTRTRVVEVLASLILSLQTGVARSPYILIIMGLILIILSIIAYKKVKED